MRLSDQHQGQQREERRAVSDRARGVVGGCGRDDHRTWLPKPPAEDTPLAAVIPLDETADLRAAASIRLHRHITRANAASGPYLPPQRQRRLILSLSALDRRLA